MSETQAVALQFDQMTARLLRAMPKDYVRQNVRIPPHLNNAVTGRPREADIMFGPPANETVVEVRYFRYGSPPTPDTLGRALAATDRNRQLMGASKGLLVTSCPLHQYKEEFFNEWPDVEVWDGPKLLDLAAVHAPLLLRDLLVLFEVDLTANAQPESPRLKRAPKVAEQRGQQLAAALQRIPTGQPSSIEFEDACINALKYLFETDLHGWHEQSSTDDGLQRRDLVCRIVSGADVWKLMVAELRSRYVVFEFKNYSSPITQQEVITTERYLYPAALRKVAIMISPHGCTASAQKVMDGAMREHGKLILLLKVEDVADWLIKKDDGSEPNTFLFERVDQFLMGLGR